jgi:hypothetical protein
MAAILDRTKSLDEEIPFDTLEITYNFGISLPEISGYTFT